MIVPEPPIPNSYWVYPGQLLAGEYPGAPKLESRNRVQRLLAAGINFFVDLTMPDELPPYAPDLPKNVEHIRLPIFDHDVPYQTSDMIEILSAIKEALRAEKRVYVHCRAGIGRTGTVIGCLLAESGISGADALNELNRLWQKCARAQQWGSVPETDDQIDYVRRWTPQVPTQVALPAAPLVSNTGRATRQPARPTGHRTEPFISLPDAPANTAANMPANTAAYTPANTPTQSRGVPANAAELSATGVPGNKPNPPGVASNPPASALETSRALVDAPPERADTPAPAINAGVVQGPARNVRERYLGALIGLAVGDALGSTVQQQARGSFPLLTDLNGGGPFNLPRGGWTDDTAMALCLAESLLESRGFDARDQIERYARWQQNGYMSATDECVGITPNTARSIKMAQWRRQLFAGSHDPKLVEPSPLSRMAPPVMFYLPFKQQALEFAGDAVRTTCQAPLALNVSRLFAAMVHAALLGQPKAQVIAPPWDLPADRPKSRIRGLIEGRYRRKDPSVIHAGDHILDTLELVLWAFDRTNSFAEGALLVANGGENSDVAGAAYGQLAGAYYGVEAIPAAWRNALIKKDLIESLALRLLAATNVEPST